MHEIENAIGQIEHVGLAMRDMSGAHNLFANKLRLPVADAPGGRGEGFGVQAGGTMLRVAPAEAPQHALGRPGVNHVAIRVKSLEATRQRLAQIGVKLAANQPPGTDGRKALWSEPQTTVGIPLQFVEQPAGLKFATRAANAFVERVDHLGVAAHSHAQARQLYVDQMGYPVECMQIDSEVLIPVETTSNDKYGSKTHVRPAISAIGSGLMALFVTVGDFDLEIMQPLGQANVRVPLGTVPGTVGQDQGAIARFLEKKGEGLLHICFKTLDIDNAIAQVSAAGIKMIDPVARPGGRGGLIAFMDRRDTEGVLMHFCERTPL
jgi:catechol 2,3-dioxygenase-like lactoylglutathione lyase family enzyme